MNEKKPNTPRNRRVLVVDDSEQHRTRSREVMEEAGFDVVTAEDGSEALRIAVRQDLDLILTDVQMPNMNGWHLLRMIRNRASLADIPVVFLTSLNSDQERLTGYRLGVDDYITKELSEEELLVRVERVLARRDATRQADRPVVLRGDLTHVSLSSLLSLMEMEARTGRLTLIRDGEVATLNLLGGEVVSIDVEPRYRDKSPLERFFHVLDWEAGRFELDDSEVAPQERRLRSSHVILEHAKQRDEAAADR